MTSEQIQSALRTLEATDDAKLRNELALQLADARVDAASDVLARLIQRPELKNNRGTLVYALGHLNCAPYAAMLITLVLEGDFEVAHEALYALETIDDHADALVEDVQVSLDRSRQAVGLEDWRLLLIEDLEDMLV